MISLRKTSVCMVAVLIMTVLMTIPMDNVSNQMHDTVAYHSTIHARIISWSSWIHAAWQQMPSAHYFQEIASEELFTAADIPPSMTDVSRTMQSIMNNYRAINQWLIAGM